MGLSYHFWSPTIDTSSHNVSISVENRKIFPPLVFRAPAEGVPLYQRFGSKKTRFMGLPGRRKSLTISSAVWIQYTNVTDRHSDGRAYTDTGRQQRPRLRIASRGKKKSLFIIPCKHMQEVQKFWVRGPSVEVKFEMKSLSAHTQCILHFESTATWARFNCNSQTC